MTNDFDEMLASLRAVSCKSECANCGQQFESFPPQPFCSARCKDVARATRYARSAFSRFGWPWPADVLEAFATKMAWATIGGYTRDMTDGLRRQVIARDDGRCVLCRRAGVDVDHVSGRAATMNNLQLLCRDCHRAKTLARAVPLPIAPQLWSEVLRRAAADPPERPCDGGAWASNWRTWVAEHEQITDQPVPGG